jgi:hypothetical protein
MKGLQISMIAAIGLASVGGFAMAQSKGQKEVVECEGRVFKWVQVAEKELAKNKIAIEERRILVFEDDESVVVAFVGPRSSVWERGAPGSVPGLEVQIRKADLAVQRTNFVR